MSKMGRPTQNLQVTTITKGKKKRKKVSLLAANEVEYYRALHSIVDAVYEEAAQSSWNWFQLSKQSGISYTTVYNLGERITRWPQFRTIFKLCRAVGWDLTISKKIAKLKTVA